MDRKIGCKSLARTIERIKPKIACFGHIYEQTNVKLIDKTWYVNCSVGAEYYEELNPWNFEWDFDKNIINHQK